VEGRLFTRCIPSQPLQNPTTPNLNPTQPTKPNHPNPIQPNPSLSNASPVQVRYYGPGGEGASEGLHEGDVLLSNHPQLAGGSHLPDITVITPVFEGGSIVFFVARCAAVGWGCVWGFCCVGLGSVIGCV